MIKDFGLDLGLISLNKNASFKVRNVRSTKTYVFYSLKHWFSVI